MEKIYKQFEDGNYFTYHFNKETPLPEKMDIKNLYFYFFTFLRHGVVSQAKNRDVSKAARIDTRAPL
jgi:hypothetical protein